MFGGLQTRVVAAATIVAVIIGAYFYGLSTGKKVEREAWVTLELERSQAFADTLLNEQLKARELERQNAEVQAEAEASKTENRRLSNEVEQLIERTPTVRTERIEVPGNCPAIECPVPDISRDFRLHNCALDPARCDLSNTAGAGGGVTELPET